MEAKGRNPWLAGILSGVLPGLGQFYNRQWLKGVGFLLATLIMDAALGLSGAALNFMQARALPPDTLQFLVGGLIVVAIALWSVVDAARTASRSRPSAAAAGSAG